MPTNRPTSKLIAFEKDHSHIELPALFTFPFCYQPHPITIQACEQLQRHLTDLEYLTNEQGRMFGVLVVKQNNHIGFLAAVSGNNDDFPIDCSASSLLVPNVFSGFPKSSGYHQQHTIVNQLNNKISALASRLPLKIARLTIASEQQAFEYQLRKLQQLASKRKQIRKKKRAEYKEQLQNKTIDTQQAQQKSIELAAESVFYKKQLQFLRAYWHARINKAQEQVNNFDKELSELKKTRSKISTKLQKDVFRQYHLLNIKQQPLDLLEVFKKHSDSPPPSGSGDCAAPKLLQFAFEHGLTPISMAEFWWGRQPKSEIRKHGHFYPSCQSKCKPILSHMLEGIALDDNPILVNPAENIELEIVYQDNDIVVINKPAGLLSVPGKHINDSVYSRIQNKFNQYKVTVVHRLDMATSGLMVLSLNSRAHKSLQKQFNTKQINKQYIADVSGVVKQGQGKIYLPLRGDINDRPRQLVCTQHGKAAETHWQVISRGKNTTRLKLYPITGRTHQLRVHCAHADGLNMPIVGDDLYGTTADRLHLHAQQLSFLHPINKQNLVFQTEPNF